MYCIPNQKKYKRHTVIHVISYFTKNNSLIRTWNSVMKVIFITVHKCNESFFCKIKKDLVHTHFPKRTRKVK